MLLASLYKSQAFTLLTIYPFTQHPPTLMNDNSINLIICEYFNYVIYNSGVVLNLHI